MQLQFTCKLHARCASIGHIGVTFFTRLVDVRKQRLELLMVNGFSCLCVAVPCLYILRLTTYRAGESSNATSIEPEMLHHMNLRVQNQRSLRAPVIVTAYEGFV